MVWFAHFILDDLTQSLTSRPRIKQRGMTLGSTSLSLFAHSLAASFQHVTLRAQLLVRVKPCLTTRSYTDDELKGRRANTSRGSLTRLRRTVYVRFFSPRLGLGRIRETGSATGGPVASYQLVGSFVCWRGTVGPARFLTAARAWLTLAKVINTFRLKKIKWLSAPG